MKPNEEGNGMPDDAADAWADVYIDVAEKLEAEDQEEPDKSSESTPARKDDDDKPS
jgi:hypothetical protein